MIQSSFINSKPLGEGETSFVSHCRKNVDGTGFFVSHPPFSLSPHLYHSNSDRGFHALSSPMMRYFSSLGSFSLSDYNKFWDGCTFMFSALPPYFLRHFDASTHLSLALSNQNCNKKCNSYSQKENMGLLQNLPYYYIN